ncbi:MAG: asparagine synthase (glutamine-hydrolyzing) [Saprospiraceae bacterium]|nr:asparagine synthase (glutamine-hydrolyzing) [Saprospiraceae bacterium]MBK9631297.1 asparagine synthase (glutamine-hydrolyzing) [Saprospiraceae bacterium]
MCGIFGAIKQEVDIPIDLVKNLLMHRGPDDCGSYKDGNLILAHVRLSILDLSEAGHQPMFSSDSNYCLIFNGEIYNYLELKTELLEYFQFKSETDTEVLLYALIKWGTSCLNKINGIFSFAFFDKIQNQLLVVRDQFGIKPLYYFLDENSFYFSSELKAIIPFLSNLEVEPQGIQNYLYLMYSPGQHTFLSQIKKLAPGHAIMYQMDTNSHQLFQYYEHILSKSLMVDKPINESLNQLEDILIRNIELQLNADVPVGFMLSGGLDSSLILALARRIKPTQDFTAYTISPSENYKKEGFSDDSYYAKLLCEHLHIKHQIISQDDFGMNEIDHLVYHLEEPQPDISPLLVGRIAEQARKDGVYVLLSGAGGDDYFSGYRRHQAVYYHQLLSQIPFSKSILQFVLKSIRKDSILARRLGKFLKAFHSKSSEPNLAALYGWIDFYLLEPLFNKEFISFGSSNHPIDLFQLEYDKLGDLDVLNKLLSIDSKYFLPDHNLNYVDKLSMASGVEVRVPLVNLELAKFSATLPLKYKMKGSQTKYLLRKLAAKHIPPEIINRPKTGFGGPLRSWFKGESGVQFLDILENKDYCFRTIFNVEELTKLYKLNAAGKVDASYTLFGVLLLESSLRQFYFNSANLKSLK